MIDTIKKFFITNLVNALLATLSPTALKNIVDSLLDMAEDAIKASETQLDDAAILPLIQAIRAAFDIPDNDEVKA